MTNISLRMITEDQVLINRALARKGVYPPINPLQSLSRLMKEAIGKGSTRDDHAGLSAQLYAGYAKGKEIRDLVAVIGEESLTEVLRHVVLKICNQYDTDVDNDFN